MHNSKKTILIFLKENNSFYSNQFWFTSSQSLAADNVLIEISEQILKARDKGVLLPVVYTLISKNMATWHRGQNNGRSTDMTGQILPFNHPEF